MKKTSLLFYILFLSFFANCFRGSSSEKPPVHVVPDMDNQPKYKAQSESKFFDDQSTMRLPVPGTVAQNAFPIDIVYSTGRNDDSSYITIIPEKLTASVLKRGKERFNIFCSPCHSQTGDGQGVVVNRGYILPPSFHTDYLINIQDGYIFNVITNGIRNMPSYAHQIPVKDRWAIVGYVRALQISQGAKINDFPAELLSEIK